MLFRKCTEVYPRVLSMKSVVYILVVLILLVYNHWTYASNGGAPPTSCYTHLINHTRQGFAQRVRDCDGTNDNCRNVRLSVRCENASDFCCEGLNVTSTRYLYSLCSYICKLCIHIWNSLVVIGWALNATMSTNMLVIQ